MKELGIPTPLDYAPAPPRWRRRVRRAIFVLLLGGVTFATWQWGPAAWKQAQLLYWQRQCLNYVAAVDEVAYDGVTVNRPECWERLMSLTGLGMTLVIPPRGPEPIVFIGELKNPAGERRLVVVEVVPDTSTAWRFPHFYFDAAVIDPGTFWTEPRKIGRSNQRPGGSNYHRKGPLELDMGRRDPKDPTRFTIRYRIDGAEHTAYGMLDANDGVRLELRTPRPTPRGGPATRSIYR